jgi:hypothetical protein
MCKGSEKMNKQGENRGTTIILLLLIICLITPFILAGSHALISRCQSALEMDIEIKNHRETVIALVKKIHSQETLYLKSSLYPEVRRYYEKLQAKLGEYYFKKGNFVKALECYSDADQYSESGYRERIAACSRNIKKESISKDINFPGDTQYKRLFKFLDIMADVVNNENPEEPQMQAACVSLVNVQLNGPGFIKITQQYEKYIPWEYDGLMNQLFHVIYTRKRGWEKKTGAIIKAAKWDIIVENKMKKILQEVSQ